MFGDDDGTPAPPAGTKAGKDAQGANAEPSADELGDDRIHGAAVENTELLHRDRLQIGGFFYARNGMSYGQGDSIGHVGLSQSTLFDAYFDGHLNERVRSFVRARLIYNPLADVPSSSPLAAFGQTTTQEARYLLDQAWIKTDWNRTVFFTLGQQHLRWGTTHVWNPVDVINPTRFNPLAFFDERVGVPMLKIDVPFEKLGWNWSMLFLTDNAVTADHVGAATRLDMAASSHFGEKGVLAGGLGFTGKAQRGQDPKAGVDASLTVDDFDFIAELGVATPWEVAANSSRPWNWTLAAGGSWTWAYREDDSLVLSFEYFHNPTGVTADQVIASYQKAFIASPTSPQLPVYTPLYTGKDYLAVIATVISPGSWIDATITALALENLTDKSGVGRLALSDLVLTDLTVEAYVSGNYGDGELRGYVPMLKPLLGTLGSNMYAPLLGAGINLRVNL